MMKVGRGKEIKPTLCTTISQKHLGRVAKLKTKTYS